MTEADRESPNPEDWVVIRPNARQGNVLTIRFPEPLDRGLLERMIAVETKDGEPVPGEVRLALDELSWQYIPYQVWNETTYRVRVNPKIEDVAGNRVDGLFDVALSGHQIATSKETAPDSEESDAVYLEFIPR